MDTGGTATEAPVAIRSRHHHGSHLHLLTGSVGARVDALVVPTAREPGMIREAVRLSADLDCALVALCSRDASAAEVARLAAESGVTCVARDIHDVATEALLPRFETTRLLAGTRFERKTDTGLKRNIGLLLAAALGWQRIVFLDDDILVPEIADLRDAVQLLDHYTSVGLWIDGYPDNSVVCHAFRETGGDQATFIGGGALAVRSAASSSFFPQVYNEDWFFLLGDAGLRPSAINGRAMQFPYDPYGDKRRARSEEFGDCLAEGIFALLDDGRQLRDATFAYWRQFLATRRRFIEETIDRAERMAADPGHRGRMIAALRAARGQSQLITPELCVRYLRAWQTDRLRWLRHLAGLPREQLLATLGVEDVLA